MVPRRAIALYSMRQSGMATKSKKKPAAPKKKPAGKKPAAKKARKPPATAAASPRADEATIMVLESTRADIVRLSEELQSALAERDRLRGDGTVATDRFRTQSAELEQLRGETAKSAAEIAAAGRRADEAGRRADEREHERLRMNRELDAARADVVAARAEAGVARRELDVARAQADAARHELAGYKLRCPKCGKNFVEEVFEGITIDRCTGCDAVYFDAGEVDQLIAKVQEKMSAPAADPQQTSGWFRTLFKRKPKNEPNGSEPPPVA